MGTLTLPASDLVYADAQIAIYTVDRHPVYAPACEPLWQAVKAGTVTAVSSYLTLMETRVGPLREGSTTRAANREALRQQANTRLLPVTEQVLRGAAALRAAVPSLKTPEAIHAAASLIHGCALLVSNDVGFRRVPGLPLALLDDVLNAP